MRFDAYSVWCGQRSQAACATTYSRLSMSPSIFLCVGDIRAIVNCLAAAGGPASKVASMMNNNSPFLVEILVTIEQIS
jgi:Mg2+/citrate symporter